MSLSSAQTKTYSQHKSGTVFKFQIPYTDHQCVCVCVLDTTSSVKEEFFHQDISK
jgi:hypothetical protein